ncbi:MAG: IS30 family transposase [Oscillospiraceae bacterium]|nr:IS30 family transposase [Oscillospiraceae bacterium]
MRKFKHFTWDDRLRLETMLKDGKTPKEIAERLDFHISSVYREIERGEYAHKKTDWTFEKKYSPEIADRKYQESLAAKGAGLKIGKDHELAAHIENKIINDKYSPAAALMDIARHGLTFQVNICVATLYSYISKGIFLNLTNKHLPIKATRKQTYRRVRRAHAPKGESIEKRPEEINERETFGHWEMDTLKGKRDTKRVILVLTERLTRNEVKIPMADNTAESVKKALDTLERRYGEMFPRIFQSFTVDNGSEFSDCDSMEKSCLHEGQRTKLFYCHPYSSWERGSNENQNRLIRRWIPKGTPLENYTDEEIAEIEVWLNNYPRAIFQGRAAADLFEKHIASLC